MSNKEFKTWWGATLYFACAGYLGYSITHYNVTGMIGPIKTKRYSTIQHWLDTGGGDRGDDSELTPEEKQKVEWLEWNDLPPEARRHEWFCWQRRGESTTAGLNWRRFFDAHIYSKKD